MTSKAANPPTPLLLFVSFVPLWSIPFFAVGIVSKTGFKRGRFRGAFFLGPGKVKQSLAVDLRNERNAVWRAPRIVLAAETDRLCSSACRRQRDALSGGANFT
jgi:hypothetical protein